MRFRNVLVGGLVAALALSGCSDSKKKESNAGGASGAKTSGVVKIDLAPALAGVLPQLKSAFESQHPGARVELRIGPMPDLLKRARKGDRPNMIFGPLAGVQLLGSGKNKSVPRTFGRNLYVIATPKGNPAGIRDLGGFAATTPRKVVICGQDTPKGNTAKWLIAKAKLAPSPIGIATSCREVIDQVTKKQIDVGLVPRTSALNRAAELDSVAISDGQNIIFDYGYTTLVASPVGESFAQFVETPAGRRIRTESGYLP